jgi:hypothetical protein
MYKRYAHGILLSIFSGNIAKSVVKHIYKASYSSVMVQNILREQGIVLFLLKKFMGARNCGVFAQNIFREQGIVLLLLKSFSGCKEFCCFSSITFT